MVTRETSYIGQLYFGLSTDDPADVAEWHNGDRILLMDQDQMFIYDEAAVTFHEIPMGGGGGGGGGRAGLDLLASGTYTLAAEQTANIVIPVSLTNVKIHMAYFSKQTHDSTGNIALGAWRCWDNVDVYPELAPAFWKNFQEMAFTNNNGSVGYSTTTTTGGSGIWFDSTTNPTTFTMQRHHSTEKFQAGDYIWFIWGEQL